LGQGAQAVGLSLDAAAILPPDHGFVLKSFLLQLGCTAAVILACALVLVKGLRAGIERASTIIMPALFLIPHRAGCALAHPPRRGCGSALVHPQIHWADLTPSVMVAAIGHMVFSLSLAEPSWWCTAPTSERVRMSPGPPSGP
jgi:NSS family neurotransmitter:Na+ symporter